MSHNIIAPSSNESFGVVNNNAELIKGLRGLADFLENCPTFPVYDDDMNLSVYIWEEPTKAKAKMREYLLAMGKTKKEADNVYFKLVKPFSSRVSIRVYTVRGNVCVRVPTGKQVLVPASEGYTVPPKREHYEEETKWECPEPILKLDEPSVNE